MNTAAAYAMDIRAVHRPQKFAPLPEDFPFTLETARQVRAFHRTIPGYVPTPLVSLERLSKLLGVAGLYVKDESARFDLNAFKVLGGSWAAARYLGQRLGLGEGELTFSRLTREDWTGLTLVTATDGNHGRGLACGEPCTVGWRVLSRWADHFVSMPDHVAAAGMRVLGAPVLGGGRIVSGESGAAGFGLALLALSRTELAPLRERLGLDQNSRVLCLSTEGATDQANYRRVVWGLDVDDLI